MRVSYVVNALGEGGTERSLADLLPGLREGGVEASLITLHSRGDEGVEPLLRQQGFSIETLTQANAPATVRKLRHVLGRQRPDVVHSMLFHANLYSRIATTGLDTKVLVSLVNTTYGEARLSDPRLNAYKVRSVQALDIGLGRFRTAHFHAVSRSVKADAVRALRLPDDKVTVIERGRRAETLPTVTAQRRASARAMLGLAPTTEVLVAVGRQEYQKGHRYLLEAMQKLADRPDTVLMIAGREGNESARLAALLDRWPEVRERTRLLGHRTDVADVLAAADLFVFPSLFEGMPGAVIEAMASGLGIVAFDIEPVRDVAEVGVNAEVVPIRNSAAFADAITKVLDDPQRRAEMGRRGREIFEERFTMERSVSEFLELYRQLSER